MARPSKSLKWPHTEEVDINITNHDKIIESVTDCRGYPKYILKAYAGKKCTVIIGCLELVTNCERDNTISLVENDKVFSCGFNRVGHISSIGIDNANKTIVIIIHDVN